MPRPTRITGPGIRRQIRLSPDDAALLERVAAAGFGGNASAAVAAAVRSMAAPPTLADEAWAALQGAARRRLRRAITQPELEVCLQATRSWWVSGEDAALIHIEIEDMATGDIDAPPDPMFGHGPQTSAPVDLAVLAAKLATMPDFDRAALTVACREWWDGSEPRPGIDAVLGGRLRGPRDN